MEKKKLHIGAGDVLLAVFSILFLIGSLTFLAPCGPKEDGGWMTCHWAGNAVAGAAAVLAVIAVLHLIAPDDRMKAGLSLAAIPAALLALLLPGSIIGLCMMDTMRCRAVMRPGAAVMSVLVIAAAVFDLLSRRRK